MAFKTVTGPLFFNNNYTTFLYALNASGLMSSLSREEIKATVNHLKDLKKEDQMEYGKEWMNWK